MHNVEYKLTVNATSATKLTAIADRNSNTITVNQPVNSSASITDGLGRTITYTYDANGHLTKVQDQTGRAVTFAYNGNDLAQVTDANGKVESYSYTTAGTLVSLLAARTLPAGNKPFTQQWDSTGRVSKQTDSRGNAYSYAFDTTGVAPTVITDPLGATQKQTHTNFANETAYTDPVGEHAVDHLR